MLFLSAYHIFPIRNNGHAIFQALTAFTSWQRSDWDTETQISGGDSGENSFFISLSIIITQACLQTWICEDTTWLFFFSFLYFFFSLHLSFFRYIFMCVFIYIQCVHSQWVYICSFTLHNPCERTQRLRNYNHYYHKNNLWVYSHTRRTHLIESISFADDGFTFCHGGCCLISMLL